VRPRLDVRVPKCTDTRAKMAHTRSLRSASGRRDHPAPRAFARGSDGVTHVATQPLVSGT